MKEDAEDKAVTRQQLLSHAVPASSLAEDLDLALNEALMFHGSTPEGVEGILRSRVKVMSKGAAHGELYGPGCYFADAVTKADTYSSSRSGDGLCGIVISRALLGNIYTTVEANPAINDLMRKINSGDFHTICGDRTKIQGHFGGWKEFIMYEEQRSLPLFLVWYRRL